MTRIRSRPFHAGTTALLAVLGVLALPGAATAATKLVRYHGVEVKVPASWPVFRLGPDSRVCVRFNRHAIYLGVPGSHQDCPLDAVGRTEAILIAPQDAPGSAAPTPVSVLAAGPAGGSLAQFPRRAAHLKITATWNRDPAAIRAALGVRSLRAAMLATNDRRPRRGSAGGRKPDRLARAVSSTTPATPGQVFTGLGFDTCTTPAQSSMSAWGTSSPYGAVGVYIGGTNAACPWGNLSATWVNTQSAAGWHVIPIYVGLQAPGNSCGCAAISTTQAAAEGTAAAIDAVAQAQALGIGTGNPIYFDMENYTRGTSATSTVLTFLEAWTAQLHLSGYSSGVYASGASGITDLVAAQPTGYLEPDDIWIAHWSTSSSYIPTSTVDSYVPSTDWVDHQRLIQYHGGRNVTYGGVKIDVDSDFLDAATAAYGSGTPVSLAPPAPSLTVSPQADGSVHLTPAWSGAEGVTAFEIVAGSASTAMAPIETVSATRTAAISLRDVYPYFGVIALGAAGQVVASSTAVATPASVAIFGNSAFVGTRGPVGVPVACLNAAPCQVQGTISEGSRRLAQTGTVTIARHGGLLLFGLTRQIHHLVATAAGRRLPVTVTVTNSTGSRAVRALNLVPYTASGKAPARRIWNGSAVQILARTNFVSNAWTGGILVACMAPAPCVTTTRVTLAGTPIATSQPQTLGAGEIGYLTFRMNNHGHALLRRRDGNQLGARVTITTAPSSKTAMALVSLDGFR